jgi:hypothetical protein
MRLPGGPLFTGILTVPLHSYRLFFGTACRAADRMGAIIARAVAQIELIDYSMHSWHELTRNPLSPTNPTWTQ